MQRRLELLKEAVPGVSRVAVLLNRSHPVASAQLREAQVAAQAMGLTLPPTFLFLADEVLR